MSAFRPDLPPILQTAVLGESEEMPEGSVPVRGYDFNEGVDYHKLLLSFATTGFVRLSGVSWGSGRGSGEGRLTAGLFL